MAKILLEMKNITKTFPGVKALNNVNLQVEEGEIHALVGENGAGKSTTMNIMTGYLGATDGEVLINGHDILKEPEAAKKSIGYLPELPPLYMDMTVMEYLKFSAELKKIKKEDREQEIEKALKLVKLADVQDRLIKNLSKGYKQRVGLAQAILGFPEIIILDEPTVGLDPKQIIEIRELIRELAKEHTVILSSHILAEIREVCDYIMIISKGKLVASDTPEHLEELMNGSDTIHIETRAEKETVREILSGLKDIEDVTYTQENEILKAEVKTKERKDIREVIFSAFAEAKCPLLTLQKTTVSLEEVFLELTGGQKSDESNL